MVIHIITRLAMGGAQQLVFELTKRIKDLGQEVVIFTGQSDKNSLSGQDNNILKDVYKNNIKVQLIPSLIDRISLFHDIVALYNICIMLKKYNSLIVHIHSSKTGILARLACKLLNIENVIYHVHGWSFSKSVGFSPKFYLWLEKLFYNLTTKYIFVCKQDMVDFINLGRNSDIASKSHIIYPGAAFLALDKQKVFRTELRKKLGVSESHHLVGAVSRMDFQKNPQIFIEIASHYSEIDRNVKFLWIGKGLFRNEVEKLIEKLDLSDKFILTGYIDEVDGYFSVFDTFIITSRYEGLPVTALKALACGIPVVGFLINGINDLSDQFNSVYGVEPYAVDDFVKGLVDAKNMIKSGKETIKIETKYVREYYNLERMCDNIIEIYDSL